MCSDLQLYRLPTRNSSYKSSAPTLGNDLGVATEFVIDMPWEQRESLIDAGQIDIAWICGLPYIRKADRPNSGLELLVAPVMLGERYRDRPVYYSDVMVRKESEYLCFEDLRGARWAYNEPGSQSGYNITRYHLAKMGAKSGFFGEVVAAGSHQVSIEMVLDGAIDAAAIDTTVLALEADVDERIGSELRVIDSLGPSPIPPLVISNQVEAGLQRGDQGAAGGYA